MTTISQILHSKNPDCALIPFITAGYPSFGSTIDALYTLDKNGADIIELGIPYADGLADGPIIQESSRIALQKGTYVQQVLDILRATSSKLEAPIIIFTYYNPILVRGIQKFIADIAYSGAKGLIIPDLPLEETDYIIKLCLEFKIELILFIAPTSSSIRMDAILSKSQGCIYLVSSTGVTGVRSQIDDQLNSVAEKIKYETNKLIILGFGISKTKQANALAKWNIDGIVIGSAFIKTMLNKSESKAIESLGNFCADMRHAIDS